MLASMAEAIEPAANTNSWLVVCVDMESTASTADAASKITLTKKPKGMRRIVLGGIQLAFQISSGIRFAGLECDNSNFLILWRDETIFRIPITHKRRAAVSMAMPATTAQVRNAIGTTATNAGVRREPITARRENTGRIMART